MTHGPCSRSFERTSLQETNGRIALPPFVSLSEAGEPGFLPRANKWTRKLKMGTQGSFLRTALCASEAPERTI
jgi:hypothetical protein